MKKRVLLVVLAMTMVMTTGCSGLKRDSNEDTSSGVETVLDMEDLEDGGYYVLRGDEYEKLYMQDTNYEVDDSKPTSSSTAHTLWYQDDWNKVPTLYKGDQLIYKTSETLDEEFCLERFEYVGYTVGVSNLKETSSGRFSFSTDPDDLNVNQNSDAKSLTELTTDTAIIDKIGGAYLRSGNVSSGGCILGLSKGKTYLAEVYAGSILHEYKLKADYIALTSMELYKSVDYDFLQSEILCINFPEYFNTGYYLINNYGLVRYVNGVSYDDDTDFNIPNIEPTDEEDTDENSQEKNMDDVEENKTIKETIKVDETGTYNVKVTYKDNDKTDVTPSAVFYDDNKAYQLYADKSSKTLSKEIELVEGEYTLELSNLDGREYTYTLEKKDSFATEEDDTEEKSNVSDSNTKGSKGGE